ncbi:MAG: transposase, partial [Deltaproteobacteria bacterium]|nr:transposase [Deltaproteobacteria bacterium]
MSMKRKKQTRQEPLWVSHDAVAASPGHPFYEALERVLREDGFDAFVESLCSPHYANKKGRPSIVPGVYFRMLLIGYFERIDSERGICWRCSDSLSLRGFLGLGLDERTPEHSSLSRIRNRLPLEIHSAVFEWVLRVLASSGLIDGKTLGVDATTLEANAALRSIVRRDSGESYESFLKELARKSGVEEPSRTDLAKLDKKRPKKGSNKEWVNPNDPDAEIMKMKGGGTHLAHKAEHAVDMSGEGAVISVTLHGGAKGDTKSLPDTLEKAQSNLLALADDSKSTERINEDAGHELVADKGYHSNDTLVALEEEQYRSYISEPDRGGRRWKDKQKEQAATYANRRRIRGNRGKRLIRRRGELLERPFAHYLEAGGMRRTHLRQHDNILKRLLTHVAGFNLGILMRNLIGKATP